MAVNDIHRVFIEQQLHGQVGGNVLYYIERTPADFAQNGSLAVAEAIALEIVPLMKVVQSVELRHSGVAVQKMWPLPPNMVAINSQAAGFGLVAGQSFPTSVSAVITKRTQYAGRKYRGRIFLLGIPATSETDSQLSAAVMPAFQAVADKLRLQLTSPTWGGVFDPVLWHQATKNWDPIASAEARPILRNQRRRQIGVGQ